LAKRRKPDFIHAYLGFTENSESPRSYHLWAAVSLISAALERKVYMRRGHSFVYPNNYIFLIGPSGVRKAEPIIIAQRFVRKIGLKMVSEAITREALIRRIKSSVGHFATRKGMKTQCAVYGMFEELPVFLGEGDMPRLAALTNWYDARDRWTYETKHMGTDEINGICFNMLGSMTEDSIVMSIPYAAIGSGFTSRILFVVEHRKGKIIANPNLHGIDNQLEADLIHDLEQINSLQGEFQMDADAWEFYERWYVGEEEKAGLGRPALSDPRFDGYNSRRATHLWKISMVCAASRANTLEITELDVQRALEMILQIETNMPQVFAKVGRSAFTEQTKLVMDFIANRGEVKMSEIMNLFYRDLDVRTLEIVEENLLAMKCIRTERDAVARDTIYTWIGDKGVQPQRLIPQQYNTGFKGQVESLRKKPQLPAGTKDPQ